MDSPNSIWDVLAGNDYPATRLSGVPLALRTSQIDYVIASRKIGTHNGLVDDELVGNEAKVHTELLDWKAADVFRKDLSDHLPVTVKIRVVDDSD